jgi:solute carrier family 45 protein 1/2/4
MSSPLSRGRDGPASSPFSPPLSRLDTSPSRPKPRPKLVSFARDSALGGRPDTDGDAQIEFIHQDNPPRMSSEVDPLLKEVMSPDEDDDGWMGESQVEETKSSWFLFLLTFGGLGLQIGWSVETSNGSVSAFSFVPLQNLMGTLWTLRPDRHSKILRSPCDFAADVVFSPISFRSV